MKRQFEISIPEPCHEQWSKMKPTEKGAFCAACSKEVTDFSKMTEQELVDFFIDYRPEQQLCGHFRNEQLGIYTIGIDPKLFRLHIPLWQKMLAILLICFGQMAFNNVQAQVKKPRAKYAQHDIKKKKKKHKSKNEWCELTGENIIPGDILVSGQFTFQPDPYPMGLTLITHIGNPHTDTLPRLIAHNDPVPAEPPQEKEHKPGPATLFKNEDFITLDTKRRR